MWFGGNICREIKSGNTILMTELIDSNRGTSITIFAVGFMLFDIFFNNFAGLGICSSTLIKETTSASPIKDDAFSLVISFRAILLPN